MAVFSGEGGKTWNTQSELKFCHQMCLIRNASKRGSVQDRLERKNTQELADTKSHFQMKMLWV